MVCSVGLPCPWTHLGLISVWTAVASGHGPRDRRTVEGTRPLPEDVWLTVCPRVPYRSLLSRIYFLLLIFLEVPLLLGFLSAVL